MSTAQFTYGFENRVDVTSGIKDPTDIYLTWHTRDGNWRYRVNPNSPYYDSKEFGKSGKIAPEKMTGVIIDPACVNIGGTENAESPKYAIISNLCRWQIFMTFDVKKMYRGKKGERPERVGIGPWGGEFKDQVKGMGGRQQAVVVVMLTSVKVSAYDHEKEKNRPWKVVKFDKEAPVLAWLEHHGWAMKATETARSNTSKLPFENAALEVGEKDYRNLVRWPFQQEGILTQPGAKNKPDHHYPAYVFKEWKDLPKPELAKEIFDRSLVAFNTFNEWLMNHTERTQEIINKNLDPDDDSYDEEKPATNPNVPPAFFTDADRPTTIQMEEAKKEKQRKDAYTKVEADEIGPGAINRGVLEAAGLSPEQIDGLIAAAQKKIDADGTGEDDDIDSFF